MLIQINDFNYPETAHKPFDIQLLVFRSSPDGLLPHPFTDLFTRHIDLYALQRQQILRHCTLGYLFHFPDCYNFGGVGRS